MTRYVFSIAVLSLSTACPAPSTPADDDDGTESESTADDAMPQTTDDAVDSTGADETSGDDDDDDDDDDNDDDDDDDDDDDTGPAMCGGSNRCVAAIPGPWLGPIARQIIGADDRVPECGGQFTDTEPVTPYAGIQADPFTCDCECTGAALACEGTARVRISNEQVFAGQSPCAAANGGAGGLLSVTLTSGVTQSYAEDQIPWDGDVHGVTVDQVNIDPAGSCTANPTEVTSPATWTDRAVVCGGQTAEDMCGEDEICVPDPAQPYVGGVCIYRTGAWTCPDTYPNREIYYEDMQDDRECSTCTCGSAAGSCGGSTVEMVGYNGNGNLTLPEILDAPNAFCQAVDNHTADGIGMVIPNTIFSIATLDLLAGAFTPDDAAAPCPPMGGMPEGDAIGVDPVTLCCTD